MEILGVNDENTKHSNEVAFDLIGDTDIDLINRITPQAGIKYIFKQGVLIIKSQHNPVSQSHAENFIIEYMREKRMAERAQQEVENKRQASLRSICKSVGYNLTSDGGGRL